MGLFDTTLVKFSPELVYMTTAEGEAMRQMLGQGLTFFRVQVCDRPKCSNEIPRSGIKKFCSKQCYEEGMDDGEKTNGKVD